MVIFAALIDHDYDNRFYDYPLEYISIFEDVKTISSQIDYVAMVEASNYHCFYLAILICFVSAMVMVIVTEIVMFEYFDQYSLFGSK